MGLVLSPAVERVLAELKQLRGGANSLAFPTRTWLEVLFADEDGRPYQILQLHTTAVTTLVPSMLDLPVLEASATHERAILQAAAVIGSRLRSDPLVTTDLVFYAIVEEHDALRSWLEQQGVYLEISPSDPETRAEPSPLVLPAFTVPDPTDLHQATRIVDANLNRAREALRILDDYARFCLNDALVAQQAKAIRHALVEAAALLPLRELITARDTLGDVGTQITAGQEYSRNSPDSIALINSKRLQEALRSCEEYGKLLRVDFAQMVEQIRYQSYTLEKSLYRLDPRALLARSRVYVLLTRAQCTAAMDWTIAQIAAGGAGIIQLREKDLPDRELLALAQDVRKWTRKANLLMIVNDRVDIARLVDADGVHLGQDDLSVAEARQILGPDRLVGVSTHTEEQVQAAVQAGADYIGIGPVFPSRTKAFDHFPGLDFVKAATSRTSLPAFALGGISLENVADVTAAGARRVALSQAVIQADDPQAVVMSFQAHLEQYPLEPSES